MGEAWGRPDGPARLLHDDAGAAFDFGDAELSARCAETVICADEFAFAPSPERRVTVVELVQRVYRPRLEPAGLDTFPSVAAFAKRTPGRSAWTSSEFVRW